MIRVRRRYRCVYVSGRRFLVAVKWLYPGVRAIDAGIAHWQLGRLLIRLNYTLDEMERIKMRRMLRGR